jgi:membrane-bound lytic murein transglycosylase F
MIARKLRVAVSIASVLVVSGCRQPLPPPGPQQELVVLTRPGPLTYEDDELQGSSGLERDLTTAFAEELGFKVRYVVQPLEQIRPELEAHQAHFAAAWLTPEQEKGFKVGPTLLTSHDTLIQHEASLLVDNESKLAGRTVAVIAGSRQERTAQRLQQRVPGMLIERFEETDQLALLQAVADRNVDLALVDDVLLDIGLNYYPTIQESFSLPDEQPIAWLFPPDAPPELIEKAQAFAERIRKDGTLARIEDRYLGHIERLSQIDVSAFINSMRGDLDRYRPYFHEAQAQTGIDWRLIAALSYQESHWDPLATSPTGVRGIMMLTEDTADHWGVDNRLDPKESILAGARYLDFLRAQVPASTPEPDRTWEALAAYNLGLGHFRAARTIARQMQSDGDSWFDLKKILPLLSRPQYYERLKSGRARGGEAVIMAENVRMFYDILSRHEKPYNPLGREAMHMAELQPEQSEPGLRLKMKN